MARTKTATTALKVEEMPLDQIKPYHNNPRKNDEAVDAVARSIADFGFRQPIVVDPKMVIIIGHVRLKAAKKLGLETVPVHIAKGLSPTKVKALRLADNKTSEISEWEEALLGEELQGLIDDDYDIGDIGFDLDDMIGGGTEGHTDPDDVPDPPKTPTSKTGDLWILGDHRVMCGDAASEVDVIVRRWEDFTKRDAVLESSGHTFIEVAQERKLPE